MEQRWNVLVVEDEAALRQSLFETLSALGFVVGEAGSVREVEPAGLIAAGGELAGRDPGVELGVTEIGQRDRELGLVTARIKAGQGAAGWGIRHGGPG